MVHDPRQRPQPQCLAKEHSAHRDGDKDRTVRGLVWRGVLVPRQRPGYPTSPAQRQPPQGATSSVTTTATAMECAGSASSSRRRPLPCAVFVLPGVVVVVVVVVVWFCRERFSQDELDMDTAAEVDGRALTTAATNEGASRTTCPHVTPSGNATTKCCKIEPIRT
jgi:hypothetical protein